MSTLIITVNTCKKQAFVAPEGSALSISSEKPKIEFNGSTRIFIQGVDASGSVLWDGTQVYFTVDNGELKNKEGGDLEENCIKLKNGYGEILAIGNMERGTMSITARSGIVVAEPNPLEIIIGRIQDVLFITASLDPPNLSIGGGRVKITVGIFDKDNLPIEGIQVLLNTDKGILDSGGRSLITDRDGLVVDYLETSEEATVTITCGEVTKDVAVNVFSDSNRPQPDFEYSPQNPTTNDVVYFNASKSFDPDGRIVGYSWDFGDGGTAHGIRVNHQYSVPFQDSKTFSVVLTVYDNTNLNNSVSKPVSVSVDYELEASPVLVEGIDNGGTLTNPIPIRVWNSKSSSIINFTVEKEPPGMFDNLTPDNGSTPMIMYVYITANGTTSNRYGSLTLRYGPNQSKIKVINFHQLPL